jgi:glycosyltransferase involved in cell wall biosynthesis
VARGTRDRGGVGRYLKTLLAAWPDDSDYSLHVVDPYGPIGLIGSLFFLALTCLRLAAGAAAGRIDVLHVHACSRGSFLRKGLITRLATRLGLPVIVHLHAPDFETFYDSLPRCGRRFVKTTLERADRVVVLGKYWRGVITERIGLAPDQVMVLLSATRGAPAPRAARDETPRIVFVGQLGARKGIGDLLHALAGPEVIRRRWTARVLGGGALSYWRRTADQLGLGDRVVFEGWVPEERVRGVLADSSIFVLPSRAEGLSIALLEAMAHGLAVVSTSAGGAADTLVHETSALLIPPGNVTALSHALARVIGDTGLRSQLQEGARRQFAAAHEIADYCRSLIRLYDEILSEPAGARR